ncbi:hypothetical protein BDM02DRAFT_2520924 [Thelephora ganbajun]|uniref:Uncharacterized protein n=1 Tax=Thelephora ganbajun TaxID=370292 RepID=A0ACB6ZEH0_THEGA|nr:hypothetical protein BDM02DRAFT_2520924 [Thelephora ganbajun]
MFLLGSTNRPKTMWPPRRTLRETLKTWNQESAEDGCVSKPDRSDLSPTYLRHPTLAFADFENKLRPSFSSTRRPLFSLYQLFLRFPDPPCLSLGMLLPCFALFRFLFPPPSSPQASFFLTSLSPPILSSILCVHSRLVAPRLVPTAVCSNPVAPFIMVSDPMDAPYGTDATCVIKSHCFPFSEGLQGALKGSAARGCSETGASDLPLAGRSG